MKKMIHSIFVFLVCSTVAMAQTSLISDENYRIMMNDYAVNLNSVLTAECPQGTTIDQFKKKIINGELVLSSTLQTRILNYAEPLKAYGTQFATTKNLNATTDAEKIFLSSFTPSTAIDSAGNLIEGNTTEGLTAIEMWFCVIETYTASGCSPHGIVGGNKTNISHLTKTVTTILTNHAGAAGVAIMMNGFGDCLSTYQAPESYFSEMTIQDVLINSPRTITTLNGLLSETIANEYTIDSTKVSRIATSDGRVSYTFSIVPKPEDTFFQNIILQTGSDGIVYNFIAEYEDRIDGAIETDSTGYLFENEKFYRIASLPRTYSRLASGLSARGSGVCIDITWIQYGTELKDICPITDDRPHCFIYLADGTRKRKQAYPIIKISYISSCGAGGGSAGSGGSGGSNGGSNGGSSGGTVGSGGSSPGSTPSTPTPPKSSPKVAVNQLVTSPTRPQFVSPYNLFINALNDNPLLLVQIPCTQIPKWQALVQFHPPQAVKDKIQTLDDQSMFTDYNIQYLDYASGAVTNLDYFPVTINSLPINPSTGTQFTPSQFLNYIRLNINDFVDTNISEFNPTTLATGHNESQIWNSSNPLGAIIHIDIPAYGGQLSPGDGSVICSETNSNHWIFTTLEVPYGPFQGQDGGHPVSGNREFGLTQNQDGTYTFYTRGVDRMKDSFDQIVTDNFINNPFENPDALWNSLKTKVSNFVKNNNGSIQLISNSDNKIWRPNWDKVKQVLKGQLPISSLGCH